MKLIPEYEPIRSIYFGYNSEFYRSPLGLEKSLGEIVTALQPVVEFEAFSSPLDNPWMRMGLKRCGADLNKILYAMYPPASCEMAEYPPLFAEDDSGGAAGMVFQNPLLEHPADFEYGELLTNRLRFTPYDLGYEFSPSHCLVNEDVALVAERLFSGAEQEEGFEILKDNFPEQHFYRVPSLPGAGSTALDRYLWPVFPKVWIAGEYPAGSRQAESVEPALRILREHGHTLQRVPGLEPLEREGVQALPVYTGGLTVNGLAVVPQYGRAEDGAVRDILKEYGYRLARVDATNLALAGTSMRALFKLVPARLQPPPEDFTPSEGAPV